MGCEAFGGIILICALTLIGFLLLILLCWGIVDLMAPLFQSSHASAVKKCPCSLQTDAEWAMSCYEHTACLAPSLVTFGAMALFFLPSAYIVIALACVHDACCEYQR